MCYVSFRMFANQMHFLIEGLDAVGVGPGIVRKLDFLTGAHMLGAPVEIECLLPLQ